MISIFIVEDDPDLRLFYKKVLETSEYQVIGMADNGEEAIYMYKLFSNKPDIILIDHHIPIKKGLEVAKEILRIDNKQKIIFASANKGIKDKALSIGAIDFLYKPFRNEMLITSIKNALIS